MDVVKVKLELARLARLQTTACAQALARGDVESAVAAQLMKLGAVAVAGTLREYAEHDEVVRADRALERKLAGSDVARAAEAQRAEAAAAARQLADEEAVAQLERELVTPAQGVRLPDGEP